MQYRFTILVLLIIVMTGCAGAPVQNTSPLSTSNVAEVTMGPELGILTDLELRVTALQPGSVAEKSDIRVGDVLVDLRWNREAMPDTQVETNVIGVDEEGRPTFNGVVITEPVPLPAPTIPPEEFVEMEAIPFKELDRIVSLVGYGLPLELRLLRNGEEITIQITPGPRTEPLLDRPERTIPDEDAYYYF
jgi:S1-C subfamily serine protease